MYGYWMNILQISEGKNLLLFLVCSEEESSKKTIFKFELASLKV